LAVRQDVHHSHYRCHPSGLAHQAQAALPAAGRAVGLLRPGVRGQRGLYRPRQLRYQHRWRHALWIQAALGAAVVERHGHPDSIPFRQAGYRHRTLATAELPRAFFTTVTIGLWVAAELAALATDLAEFLGAAL